MNYVTSQNLIRIDAELRVLEDKEGIQRWSVDSDVYMDHQRMQEAREKAALVESIGTCARERWFLLNLKAKFAGTVECVFATACSIILTCTYAHVL